VLKEIVNEPEFELSQYWFRGGFPDSYLAPSDEVSILWLENFLRTYVERDIPQLGFQIPAQQLLRMLTMTAHIHGQLFNASKLGESLGLTHTTIRRYLDLLEQTFILRSLPAWESNSPKVFVRDSGLLNRLLRIRDYNHLMGHPIFGSSWEGVVIENICNHFPEFEFSFYRSAVGDEMDLIVQNPGLKIAIECKASTAPKPEKSFYRAIEVIKPDKTFIVAPIKGHYPYKTGIEVCGLSEIIDFLGKIHR